MSLTSEYAPTTEGPYGPSGLRSSISLEPGEINETGDDLSWALHNDLHEEDLETPTLKTLVERA